jgi:hypothetical protein
VAKKSILHANLVSPGAIQRKKYEKVEFNINVKNRQTLLLFVGSGAIFIAPTVNVSEMAEKVSFVLSRTIYF